MGIMQMIRSNDMDQTDEDDNTCAICENPRDHCTCDWRGPYPRNA